MKHMTKIHMTAGAWIIAKVRRQQTTAGTLQAAKNCRKQGMPFELALAILTGRL